MFLGERQRHAAVAGADQIGLLQIDRERILDHLLDVGRRRFNRIVGFQHTPERAAEFVAQLAGRRPVFHLDDRFVVDIEQQVVGKTRVARDLFRVGVVARAGDVAEEVRFAFGAGRIKLGRLGAQALEHFAERILHAGRDLGEAFALDLADAGLLQIVELLEKLLEAKGSLERAEERVEVDQPMGGGKRPAEQRELPVDARLLARHARGGRVVRARIGDAVADHLAILVEEDRLGRRRTEVDADESLHAFLLKPPRQRRRVSDRPSGNSSPGGS